MDVTLLSQELERDEGLRLHPYRDSVGKLTIGIGRNLDDVGISQQEARYLLASDIGKAIGRLDLALPWWKGLDEVRQRVLANMAFNMGIDGLLSFKHTLQAVESGQYAEAAAGMRDSLWARQVGPRAERLAAMMEKGAVP